MVFKVSEKMLRTHELLRNGSSIKDAIRETGISRSAICICQTCREILNLKKSVRNSPIKERFEAKFRVTPGCWIWEASRNNVGYGQFKTETTMDKAHRVSYRLYIGDIPDGMHVLHKCDNRLCVNPDHFFLGDQGDNMRDMEAKGRANQPKGESNFLSKLTEEQVRQIRASSEPSSILAMRFNVSQFAIRDVKRRRTWKHL